jgi:lipopolysaccharide biosynthesis glycosyltransferase
MKVGFVTTLDDKYITGFLLTLNSLLNSSSNFNYDIVILEWGELSQESKDLISLLYKNVIYKFVDVESYADQTYDETWRKWTYNCNYRFDIFLLNEYDKLVFFDSDILFEIDVEELLSHNVDFGACETLEKNSILQINERRGFDAGLMLIDKKYLVPETKKCLLEIARSVPPFDKKVKTEKWISDEPILNHYFLDKITWLPNKFNYIVSCINENTLETPNNYQFTGHNKPWYGDTLKEQFGNHVFWYMQNTIKDAVMARIILKKLVKKYYFQVADLLKKGIDIKKLQNVIKPI